MVAVGCHNHAPRPARARPQATIDGRRDIGRVLYGGSVHGHHLDDLLEWVGDLWYELVSSGSTPGIDIVPVLRFETRTISKRLDHLPECTLTYCYRDSDTEAFERWSVATIDVLL